MTPSGRVLVLVEEIVPTRPGACIPVDLADRMNSACRHVQQAMRDAGMPVWSVRWEFGDYANQTNRHGERGRHIKIANTHHGSHPRARFHRTARRAIQQARSLARQETDD